jgi:hypothetical protein
LVADLNEKSGFLHWEMGQQTVYDLAEKHALSLDLIEKKSGRNDSVYELTEIDNGAGMFQQGGRLVGKAKPAMRATAPAYAKSSLGKSFGPL